MAQIVIHNTLSGSPTLEVSGGKGATVLIPQTKQEEGLVDLEVKLKTLYNTILDAYDSDKLRGVGIESITKKTDDPADEEYVVTFTDGRVGSVFIPRGEAGDIKDLTAEAIFKILGYEPLKDHQDISGKQDVIEDLDEIRSGAKLGETAIQEHQDISHLAEKSEIPTKVSELTNDRGYLTQHQDISGKQDVISDLSIIRMGAALGATALREHQDISGKQDKLSAEQLANIADVVNKVAKEAGKGLSANDFTDALKTKLEGLSNYNDSAVRGLIETIEERINTLVGSDDATSAIDTFNEIVAFLANIQDKQTLEGILNGINDAISKKQDTISDLEDIRFGASKGKTAIQSHQSISHLALKSEIPTKVSQLTNDSGFLTEHQDLSDYQQSIADLEIIRQGAALGATALQEHQSLADYVKKESIVNLASKEEVSNNYQPKGNYALKTDLPTVPTRTSELTNDSGFLTEHQDLSGYQLKITDLETIRDGASKGATSVQPSAISDMETKTHAANTYQPKGNYLTQHQDISLKVDKVDGKGLSTNDYTDEDKQNLKLCKEGLSEIDNEVSDINERLNKISDVVADYQLDVEISALIHTILGEQEQELPYVLNMILGNNN